MLETMLYSFSMLIVAACLFSCDTDDHNGSKQSGLLRLNLVADTTSLKKGVDSSTRTISTKDEFAQFLITSDYKIRIVQGKDTVQAFKRYDEMPSEMRLQEGAYTLVAYKGDDLPAAFENPYFEGNTDFTVKADMSTPIDVTCTLSNARVTVDYTEDFKKVFTDCTASLKTSAKNAVSIEIAQNETRPAYLQVAKDGTALSITLRLKKVGEAKEITYPVPAAVPLERRQNVRLIFKTDGTESGLGLDIQIDDELVKQDIWETIPDFMLPEETK